MANSVDPDQTAPYVGLVYTVCMCHFVVNFGVWNFRTLPYPIIWSHVDSSILLDAYVVLTMKVLIRLCAWVFHLNMSVFPTMLCNHILCRALLWFQGIDMGKEQTY